MAERIIPLSQPFFNGNEQKYVLDALNSGWVSTGGKEIVALETQLSKYLNAENVIACQSGTAAIHMALLLAGVSQEDEVIVPTLTFIAAVNPVKYIGAAPIFMDCDNTLNLDMEKVEDFLESQTVMMGGLCINKITKRQIKAIIVVHVFGNLAHLEKIEEITTKYNLKIIEDATEALGSFYVSGKHKGKAAGTVGDFGALSFNGNKIITTGGGGALITNSKEMADRARYLSTQAKDDDLYYIHNEVGFNYRMTNLQAALGLAQLESIESFIEIKESNYEIYKRRLKNANSIHFIEVNRNSRWNHWFFAITFHIENMTMGSLLKYFIDEGIQVRPIWYLNHLQKPYVKEQNYEIEKATDFVSKTVCFPCSSSLTAEEVHYICDKILQIVGD